MPFRSAGMRHILLEFHNSSSRDESQWIRHEGTYNYQTWYNNENGTINAKKRVTWIVECFDNVGKSWMKNATHWVLVIQIGIVLEYHWSNPNSLNQVLEYMKIIPLPRCLMMITRIFWVRWQHVHTEVSLKFELWKSCRSTLTRSRRQVQILNFQP